MTQKRAFEIDNHRITPLHDADMRLDAVLKLLHKAQESIQLVVYIFSPDQTGREIRDALIDAANRGVAVKLMIDSFGSSQSSDDFFAPLVEAGGEYIWFSSKWNLGYFIRNHQKIIIADKKTAIIGGFNIADSYFDRAGDDSWHDFGIHLVGNNVEQLSQHVDDLYVEACSGGVRFHALRQLIKNWPAADSNLTWLIGGPTNRLSPWAIHLKHDLESASRFDAVCAYFTPTQGLLRRIGMVTKQGEGGNMILAGQTDNGVTIAASRLFYKYLLKRKAQIFEYQAKRLHMKLLILDDAVYIGSANLGVRSLFINMEIMLRIHDAGFADYMRGVIAEMTQDATRQTLDVQKSRGWMSKIWSSIAYLMVGSIDYTIGRRVKFLRLRKKKDS